MYNARASSRVSAAEYIFSSSIRPLNCPVPRHEPTQKLRAASKSPRRLNPYGWRARARGEMNVEPPTSS